MADHTLARDGGDRVTVSLPRAAFTLIERPRCVSQRTSLAVMGLAPREYLATIRAYVASGGTAIRIGRTICAELDPLVEWLARRERTLTTAKAEVDPVDALASSLGLRAIAGGRR